MQLSKWLEDEGLSQAEFARAATALARERWKKKGRRGPKPRELKTSTVAKICAGGGASVAIGLLIVPATRGKVTWNDLAPRRPRKAPKRRRRARSS